MSTIISFPKSETLRTVQACMKAPDYQVLRTDANATDKRTNTLQAQVAQAGLEMHIINGNSGTGKFWISRWGVTRVWSSLDDAESFGRLAGAVQ